MDETPEDQQPPPSLCSYTIYIDSTNRDMVSQPNPFKFTAEFDALPGNPGVCVPFSVRELHSMKFSQVILPLRLVPSPGERYFVLRVRELDIPFQYHSSSALNNSTDIVLYNSGVGGPNLYLDARSTILFPTGQRLRRLTFEFLTPQGQPLEPLSNAMSGVDMEHWNLVFPHLFRDDDDDDERSARHLLLTHPEMDPCKTSNNVFMELQIGARPR